MLGCSQHTSQVPRAWSRGLLGWRAWILRRRLGVTNRVSSQFCARLHFLQQFPAFPRYLIPRSYLFPPLRRYFHPTLSIYFGEGGGGGSSPPPANRLINSHLCLSPTIQAFTCTNVHRHKESFFLTKSTVLLRSTRRVLILLVLKLQNLLGNTCTHVFLSLWGHFISQFLTLTTPTNSLT